MGKSLYGKGNVKSSRGNKSSATAADDHGWVTVTASVPDEQLLSWLVAAFSDARAPPEFMRAQELHDSLAASLIEYAADGDGKADCDEAWLGLLHELATDFGISLADPDAVESDVGTEGDMAQAAERAGAEALLRCLKSHKALCAEPPPPPPLAVGTFVLAILEEDGDWHEAVVVEKTDAGGLGRAPQFAVRFAEWPKVQETSRAQIVSLAEVADDDDSGIAQSESSATECELCARSLQLTFHHLIPKETHQRYLTRGSLPEGVAEVAIANGLEPHPLTREFLHRHGALLCRFCHSTVHRLAPNAVLAERFNTLEKLRASEGITRFVAYAARQKNSAKGVR